MAPENELKVKITSDSSGLKTGSSSAAAEFDQACNNIKSSANNMNAAVSASVTGMTSKIDLSLKEAGVQIKKFNESIGGISKAFSMIGQAVMLGFIGEKIFDLAKKTAEYAHEMELTSQKVGMNIQALQGWGFAASLAGGSIESITLGMRKFSKEIVNAKEGQDESTSAFRRLGISIEELKSLKMEDLMLRVADSFSKHSDGAEKSALAVQLFGRSGLNLIPILNQGRDGIEQLMQKAKELGVIMSEDDIKAAAGFKEQLELLEAGTGALKRRIGMDLLPALTGLVTAFQDSMKTGGQLNDLMKLLPEGIKLVAYTVSYASEGFQMLGRRLGAFAAITDAVLHGNLAGAKAIVNEFNKDYAEIKKGAEDFRASLSKPLKIPPVIKQSDVSDKPAFGIGDAKKPESMMPQWEQQLKEKQVAEEKWFGLSIEEEKTYWQDKLSVASKANGDYISILNKVNDAIIKGGQASVQQNLTALKGQESDNKLSWDIRLNAVAQHISLVEKYYGKDTGQYQQALNDQIKLLNEKKEQETQIAAKGLQDQIKLNDEAEKSKQETLNFQEKMGQITADQELANEIKSENDRYKIEFELLEKLKTVWAEYPKEYKAILDQIQAAAQKHGNTIKKYEQNAAIESANSWRNFISPVVSSYTSAISGLLTGTTTFAQAFKQLGQSMLDSFLNVIGKMVEKWMAGELTKISMSKMFSDVMIALGLQKAAVEETTAATSTATVVATNTAKATSNIGVAATGAASAVAPTPYIGPALAIAAAAAMIAGLAVYAAKASAAGGYDIPSGVNPVTQLHAEEMVLPAGIATGFRKMFQSGGHAPTGGGPTIVNNIQAWDSRDMGQFMKRNGRTMLKSLAYSSRSYGGK